MMTTIKITKIVIDKVARVEVEKLDTHLIKAFEFCQRSITVWDEKGDKYELILEAASTESLEFKEADGSEWLKPRVYKGSEEE